MNDDDETKVGPCCGCGVIEGARNLVMYDFVAPGGFTGWGCVVCDLPPHGAIAVLCDRCAENGVEPKFICGGKYAAEGVRVSLDGYERKPFHHNTDKHPELQYEAPEEFEGEQWEQEL
jgi:hypothetical protein